MEFSLSTLRVNSAPTPVIEVGGQYFRLDLAAPHLFAPGGRGLIDLFADWSRAQAELTSLAPKLVDANVGLLEEPDPADFMTPLQFPNKLLLGGANYYEHMIKEAGKPDFRKELNTPSFFLKPPTTSLVGCGKTVRFPVQSRSFDWEIELAVVIGSRLKRVSVDEASAAIAAYAVGIDLSARDWQMNPNHPWQFDLMTGKSFDDSCPLGPKLVPAAFVDPTDLQLNLKVNGVTKQSAHSSDMIWTPAEQISFLSEHLTLEPGDVLLTGTPAGTGLATGQYLQAGDRLEATISGLGTLWVEITPDVATSRTPRAG